MAASMRTCEFRFYAELNDLLPRERRKVAFTHAFTGTPSVKDPIEALGVPHTEVDLILVDGESVGFGHRLRGGERVAVYPVFERFDIAAVTRVRAEPLRELKFVLDVHLGRLAAYLRMLGFDCVYFNDLRDEEIVRLARAEQRIVLTRDIGLLKNGLVERGAYLRGTDPMLQVREVLDRFHLERLVAPFTRCVSCNGPIARIAADEARPRVPDAVADCHADFSECRDCRRVYWPGSHVDRLRERFAAIGVRL
ncbi:MAG TPA: DUF5615 family PIN-like protein [Xanthomonadales bacterium]|nr:DUF5615 family PIN-like protein [Xanthomonadales bacterium]